MYCSYICLNLHREIKEMNNPAGITNKVNGERDVSINLIYIALSISMREDKVFCLNFSLIRHILDISKPLFCQRTGILRFLPNVDRDIVQDAGIIAS